MFSVPSVISVLASLLVLYPRSGSGSATVLDLKCGRTRYRHSSQTLGPWTAMLHENGRIFCAGTLIHRQFILTAAHCIKEEGSPIVRLGIYGRVGAEKADDYVVDMNIPHLRYNKETMENDIGLMRLARPVQYKEHITPICIVLEPSSKYLELIDELNDFTGTAWELFQGKERYRGWEFYAINITRVQSNYCQRGHTLKDKLQFCGKNQQANDFCDGPSGSALSHVMSDDFIYQFGIASFNDLDCRRTRLYTSVAHYSEWIEKAVSHFGTLSNQRIQQPVVFPTRSTKNSQLTVKFSPNSNTNRQFNRF